MSPDPTPWYKQHQADVCVWWSSSFIRGLLLLRRKLWASQTSNIDLHTTKPQAQAHWKPGRMAKGPVTVVASGSNCLCELDHQPGNHQPTQSSMISCKMIIAWCRSMISKPFCPVNAIIGKWFSFFPAFHNHVPYLWDTYLWLYSCSNCVMMIKIEKMYDGACGSLQQSKLTL